MLGTPTPSIFALYTFIFIKTIFVLIFFILLHRVVNVAI